MAFRAFYAIKELRTSRGLDTNAVYGFIRMLQNLRERWKPTHWAVVFDGGLPEERTDLLETYKADREEVPDPLEKQWELIDEYLEAACIPSVWVPGEEADDIIATLATRAADKRVRVLIAGDDKDFYQLVGGPIRMVPQVKSDAMIGPREVQRRTGVPPSRMPAWQALVGDRVDGVPGVPGIGPKTAARLLNRFGSLPGIWSGMEKVEPERVRTALRIHKQDIRRNLKLCRLNRGVVCGVRWDRLAVREPEDEPLLALLERLEFNNMAEEVRTRKSAREV
jgi:DNA polymerase-1